MYVVTVQGAPEVEIDKLSGDPLEYQYSVPMFNQIVEKKVLKFTGGEAKKLIKHCIYCPSETGYETDMRLLNKSYENPLYV